MKFQPSSQSNPGRNFDYPIPLEGGMAKNYLRQMEEDARRLRLSLDDQDELPGWVNAYIFTSADRLQQASRYMQGRIAEQGYGDAVDRRAFWKATEQMAYEPMNWLALGVVVAGSYMVWDLFRDSMQAIEDHVVQQQKEAKRKKRLDDLYGRKPKDE